MLPIRSNSTDIQVEAVDPYRCLVKNSTDKNGPNGDVDKNGTFSTLG